MDFETSAFNLLHIGNASPFQPVPVVGPGSPYRSKHCGTEIHPKNTPWKFNSSPLKNRPSQKESNLPTIIFQGLC